MCLDAKNDSLAKLNTCFDNKDLALERAAQSLNLRMNNRLDRRQYGGHMPRHLKTQTNTES